MGATGTKPSQLAPKEIGGCNAPRWSGLGPVGKHSRTEHGQLREVVLLTPVAVRKDQPRVRRTGFLRRTGPSRRVRMSSPSTTPMGDHGFDAKRAFLHRGPKGDSAMSRRRPQRSSRTSTLELLSTARSRSY